MSKNTILDDKVRRKTGILLDLHCDGEIISKIGRKEKICRFLGETRFSCKRAHRSLRECAYQDQKQSAYYHLYPIARWLDLIVRQRTSISTQYQQQHHNKYEAIKGKSIIKSNLSLSDEYVKEVAQSNGAKIHRV